MPSVPRSVEGVPSVSAFELKSLLLRCADLTVTLTQENAVKSVHSGGAVRDLYRCLQDWRGTPLRGLLTPDSVAKLAFVLADNAADAGSEGRWRHLNFKLPDNTNLPLLVKYFCISQTGFEMRALCCRDLRPAQDLQQAFQQKLVRLEAEANEEA